MVECHLAKVKVASSNLVFRSKLRQELYASVALSTPLAYNKIWRHSQVVRQGSAKPRFPSSNLGGASTSEQSSLCSVFLCQEKHPPASLLLLSRKRSRLLWRCPCKRGHDASAALPTFCECALRGIEGGRDSSWWRVSRRSKVRFAPFFFVKKNIRLLRCSSFLAKGHACCGDALVNAGMTPALSLSTF